MASLRHSLKILCSTPVSPNRKRDRKSSNRISQRTKFQKPPSKHQRQLSRLSSNKNPRMTCKAWSKPDHRLLISLPRKQKQILAIKWNLAVARVRNITTPLPIWRLCNTNQYKHRSQIAPSPNWKWALRKETQLVNRRVRRVPASLQAKSIQKFKSGHLKMKQKNRQYSRIFILRLTLDRMIPVTIGGRLQKLVRRPHPSPYRFSQFNSTSLQDLKARLRASDSLASIKISKSSFQGTGKMSILHRKLTLKVIQLK